MNEEEEEFAQLLRELNPRSNVGGFGSKVDDALMFPETVNDEWAIKNLTQEEYERRKFKIDQDAFIQRMRDKMQLELIDRLGTSLGNKLKKQGK